jgi:hypothetical protein
MHVADANDFEGATAVAGGHFVNGDAALLATASSLLTMNWLTVS